MKVHFLNKIPDICDNGCRELEEFNEYELDELINQGIDEIWYWYATEPYEGVGHILMRKGNLYDLHNASHCSCYGPTDRVVFRGHFLYELAYQCSDEYFDEVKDLFAMAGLSDNIKIKKL